MFLQKAQTIHCIGIGGSGLSALASILYGSGKTITGSDSENSELIDHLKKSGIKVTIGHNAENIPENTDLIIYSSAIPESNPEIIAAAERNIPSITYPNAVGELTKEKHTIAVCGTHGKTTTTAMISAVFLRSGLKPTIILGSTSGELEDKNHAIGSGEYFILESCEYKRAFLNYYPSTVVITNIEVDHLDYYKDEQDYKSAFYDFLLQIRQNGTVVASSDDQNVREVIQKIQKERPDLRIVELSMKDNVDYSLSGNTIFNHHREKLGELNLKIPGVHNLQNALSAFAASIENDIPPQKIINSLNAFNGTVRRFHILGKLGKTTIIDDYAHHPTEIRATLKSAREQNPRAKVLAIFQPHQYSRTIKLLDEFSTAFNDADEVIIPDIYQVRDNEADVQQMSAEKLVEAIAKNHPEVSYGGGLEQTIKTAQTRHKEFDIIISMGAGNVWQITHELIKLSTADSTS